MQPATVLRFGPFVFDPANQRVSRGVDTTPLTPKSFAVLSHLLARAGELVSKDELLDAVWPDVHVGDAVLKTSVREIRKALADRARDPLFIETVHRRGYRFIAPVDLVPVPGDHARAARGSRDAGPAPAAAHPPATRGLVRPVGRDVEMRRLDEFLERALGGHRQIVFVTGEPGIGKTTLIDAFLDRLEGRGIWATRGQCLAQHGAGEAYMAVLEALGGLGRRPDGQTLVSILARHAPTWLVQLPSLAGAADRDALQRDVLGATRERMLREMAEAVEALTAEVPLVLVLEDLHWSDFSTLDLLASLAQRREPARLLLIGTFRPVDVIVRRHPLRMVKQELVAHGQCHELAMQFLSASAVAEYLTGRLAGEPIAPELPSLIHRRTDGHPLFMVSVVDYLLATGALGRVEGRWALTVGPAQAEIAVPDNVREVIERQFEELADEEQALLEVASVAGLEFSAALVAAALEAEVTAVEAGCQSLARRGQFLAARGAGEWPDGTLAEQYAFIHSLHRDALYQRVAASRRLQLHQRIGRAMERVHGSRAPQVAAELAVHFEQGREFGRAASHLLRAAETAARRFANQEATEHLTHALALLDRAPEGDADEARLAVLERRGMLRRAMGQIDGAAEDFDALARGARARGRVEDEAKALFYLASAVFTVDGDRCLAAAQRAVDLSRDLPDELLRARTRGSSGYWHSVLRGWRPEDARACEEAVAAARQSADRGLLTLLVARSCYFGRIASDYRGCLATAEEGARLALEVGDAYEYLFCQFSRAQAQLFLGAWGQMRATVAAGSRMAERNGSRLWHAFFQLSAAWLHQQAHDFKSSGALAQAAVAEARAIPHPYCELLGLVLLGTAELGLDEREPAFRHLSEARVRMQGPGPRDHLLQMPLLHALGEYWLAQGDLERAGRAAEELCATAAPPGERTWMALGARMLAQVAAAGDAPDRARTELGRAMHALEGGEAPLAAWRVHATAAELLEPADGAAAGASWRASAEVLRGLAASLGDGAPLGKCLLGSAPARRALHRAESCASLGATGRRSP